MFIFESSNHKFKITSSIDIYNNNTNCDKNKFNNFTVKNDKKVKETIFYIKFIFDNSKDTYENKEKILKKFFNVLSIISNNLKQFSESSIELLNKFIRSKFI